MQSDKNKQRTRFILRPWVLGIVLAVLLFALLFTLFHPQYVTNDDAVILRAFMGYEGGEPASFHLYTHTVLAWFLYGLAKLFPGVAWFSLIQLALLFVSCAVIIKSFAQIVQRNLRVRYGALWGALFGLLLTMAMALFNTVRITYSCTAALCGAAAVAHLFSIDFNRSRGVAARMLGGAALLLCNYCLRQITVLPPLCFYGLAIAIKLLTGRGTRRAIRPVLTGMLCTALLFGLFAGLREADIFLSDERDYIAWQAARISVLDYTDYLHQTTPETLQTIGWSETLKNMTGDWYFLDDRITTDAFRTIREQVSRDTHLPAGLHLQMAWRQSAALFAKNHRITFAVFGALLTALMGILISRRRDGLWAALGSACALLGGAAILVYFAWRGRISDRVALTAILPMIVYLTASAFSYARPWSALQSHKVLAALAALVFAGALAANGLAIAHALTAAEQKDHQYWGEDIPEVDIDEYALNWPEYLFIYDYSMPSNEIVFPDTRFGIPTNVMSWGGWAIHSPSWRRMVQNFGIHELNASVFLRDNVIYATRCDSPPQLLLQYLRENIEGNVEWEFFDTYGVIYFYTFYTN